MSIAIGEAHRARSPASTFIAHLYLYGHNAEWRSTSRLSLGRWCGLATRRRIWGGCPRIDTFGYALHLAQTGKKHEQAKPLRGFGSAGVLEIVEDWRGNTYRAVYTVRFAGAVFVLHVFQKKAKSGIATPKQDIELIRERLKAAEQIVKELSK